MVHRDSLKNLSGCFMNKIIKKKKFIFIKNNLKSSPLKWSNLCFILYWWCGYEIKSHDYWNKKMEMRRDRILTNQNQMNTPMKYTITGGKSISQYIEWTWPFKMAALEIFNYIIAKGGEWEVKTDTALTHPAHLQGSDVTRIMTGIFNCIECV